MSDANGVGFGMPSHIGSPVAPPNAEDFTGVKNSTISILLGSLLVCGGLEAQHDKDHNDAFVPGQAGETQIAREVRHELVMLPYYGIFDDLAFLVTGNVVTLVGQVVNPTLKSDAGNVAKRVEGVAQVINKIEVLPPSPMDDQIRAAEYRAIYGDPALSTRYAFRALPSIHILVKSGHVTLEGVVANTGDKNLINIRANTVPNVFSVTNNLQVEGS
jgi:hyperosmotically inducible protein